MIYVIRMSRPSSIRLCQTTAKCS